MAGRNLLEGRNLVQGRNLLSQGIDEAAKQAQVNYAATLTGPEARLAAMGSAVNDVAENLNRAGQFVGEKLGILGETDRARLEKQLSADDEAFAALRAAQPGNTAVGRGIAQMGMFAGVPGGVAGNLATRSATAATAGGVIGGLSTASDEDHWTNIGLGAAFGGAAPAALGGAAKFGRAMSRVFRRYAGKPIQVVVDGRLTDDAIQLLEDQSIRGVRLDDDIAKQLQKDGVLSAEEARRFNFFKEFDPEYQPLRAEVTQTGDDWIRQREALKKSNVVSQQVINNEKVIAQNVDNMIAAAGGRAIDDISAGNAITNTIFNRINSADAAVDEAYQLARNLAKGKPSVNLSGLSKTLERYKAQDRTFYNAIKAELKWQGALDDAGNLQPVSVEAAESIRQEINSLISRNVQERARNGRFFKNAIDDDVRSAVGGDVFQRARVEKTRLERSLERAQRTRRSKTRDSLLEKMVQERIDPEKALPQIANAPVDDIKQLFGFLRSGNSAEVMAGNQAIGEIRSGLIRRWFEKSVNLSDKVDDGIYRFSGVRFAKQLDNIGNERLQAIFSPEQLTWLGQLRRIGELRIPRWGSAQGMGPSAVGVREVGKEILDQSDEKTRALFGLLRKLTSLRQDVRDIRNATMTLSETQKAVTNAVDQVGVPGALRAAQRRPVPISVGATTADRLIQGSEE